MPYTYILYSKKLDKYYVGSCINLERRLYEHNIGHSKFTSTGIPWVHVYVEEFETPLLAARREKEIKNKKSRKYIEELIKKGGEYTDSCG
jgi:putative endonuclease